MYTSPDLNYEDRLRHSIISICYRKIPGVSSKFSITPENGFIELALGKTIKREVRLECRMFKRFLKPGEKRYLLYTGAGYRNVIQYWRYGTLESLKDQQADYSLETPKGGIVLPRSNIIDLTVIE
ncbi:MAG: hypothetical protein M1830_002900 [Pleopsidium flavum]|nr:MAG: hypothetical protein M1830_002900 [Pleopsidium flavum]